MALPPWHPESLAARLPFLARRGEITAATRAWFTARGYREVETPCLVPVPGMEVNLQGFATDYIPHLGAGERQRLWLRTSPELALKRLLVAFAGPVFELARVWRNGEHSPRHAPEFTMLLRRSCPAVWESAGRTCRPQQVRQCAGLAPSVRRSLWSGLSVCVCVDW